MNREIDLCIGGMHRSGTSLMAQICLNSGLYIGNDLDPNLESKTYLKINDWLLTSNGMSWYNPELFTRIETQIANDKLISQYITQRLTYSKYFRMPGGVGKKYCCNVFKDPRTTFTYRVWKKFYPNLKMIIVVRNGFDVANSLMVRNTQVRKSYETNKYKIGRLC